MSLYLDSADVGRIESLWGLGVFSGVTTNPLILHKAGLTQRDLPMLHGRLHSIGVPVLFAQTTGSDVETIWRSANEVLAIGSDVIVKVPAVSAGIEVAKRLVDQGSDVLLTAVFHPTQALIARELGVWGIAPYVGRISDSGVDAVVSVGQMTAALRSSGVRTLAASLRDREAVAVAVSVGCTDFTVSDTVASEMADCRESVGALEEFEAVSSQE